MDFRQLLEMAWQNTLRFLGPVIILTLVYFFVAVISLGILGPVITAGYIDSLLQASRSGRSPEVKDLFSKLSLFLPLLLLFLVMLAVVAVGFMLFVVPGFLVVALIVFATFYLFPLLTDTELGVFAALQQSWRMATREPVTDQIAVVVLYLVIVSIGGSIPLVFLVAQPFAVFLLLGAYEKRLQQSDRRFETANGPPPPPPE